MMPALLPLALAAIEPLLLAYWVLATASVVVTVLPSPVPQAFKDAVVLSASRGKLWEGRPRGAALPAWLRNLSVPQRWFLHFYLVGALANALALFFMLLFFSLAPPTPLPNSTPSGAAAPPLLPILEDAEALLCLALFQLHLVRRALETALLLDYPKQARMHAIAYAFGLSYYLAAPLSLLPRGWSRRVVAFSGGERGGGAGGVVFAALEGSGGGASAAVASLKEAAGLRARAAAATLASSGARRIHLAGALLFLAASALQLASHAALARLSAEAQQGAAAKRPASSSSSSPPSSRRLRDTPARRRHRGAEEDEYKGEKGRTSSPPCYALPRGPLFALVSCPHYSAEVLLYAALAVLTRLSSRLPLLMAAWVAFNLALAARATHAWYAQRFGGAYLVWGRAGGAGVEKGAGGAPWWRRRRALVPFLL